MTSSDHFRHAAASGAAAGAAVVGMGSAAGAGHMRESSVSFGISCAWDFGFYPERYFLSMLPCTNRTLRDQMPVTPRTTA